MTMKPSINHPVIVLDDIKGALQRALKLTRHHTFNDWDALSAPDLAARVFYDTDHDTLNKIFAQERQSEQDKKRAFTQAKSSPIQKYINEEAVYRQMRFEKKQRPVSSVLQEKRSYNASVDQLMFAFSTHHFALDIESCASDWCVNEALKTWKLSWPHKQHCDYILEAWANVLTTQSDDVLKKKLPIVEEKLAQILDRPVSDSRLFVLIFHHALENNLVDRVRMLIQSNIMSFSDTLKHVRSFGSSDYIKQKHEHQQTNLIYEGVFSSQLLCTIIEGHEKNEECVHLLNYAKKGETLFVDTVLAANASHDVRVTMMQISQEKADVEVFMHVLNTYSGHERRECILKVYDRRDSRDPMPMLLMPHLTREEKNEVYKTVFTNRSLAFAEELIEYLDPQDAQDITLESMLRKIKSDTPKIGAALERCMISNVIPAPVHSTPKKKM